MAGLASRVAPERDVLRGEALRGTAAVRGARWCRWSAVPGRCWCGGGRRSAASSTMTGYCRAGDAVRDHWTW